MDEKDEVSSPPALLSYPYCAKFYDEFAGVPPKYLKRLQWWPLSKLTRALAFVFYFCIGSTLLLGGWVTVLSAFFDVMSEAFIERGSDYTAYFMYGWLLSLASFIPIFFAVLVIGHCDAEQAFRYLGGPFLR